MNISITIDTSNAAFEDNPDELSRILTELAAEAYQKGTGVHAFYDHPIKDAYGNTVGHIKPTTLGA
jgi:hypothetical protein